MKLADNDYLILTPAGVLHAFSYIEANEKQQALQALLPSQHVNTANDWVQRYGAIWLKQFIDEGWVEIIDKRLEVLMQVIFLVRILLLTQIIILLVLV